jgi:hypothetical protein
MGQRTVTYDDVTGDGDDAKPCSWNMPTPRETLMVVDLGEENRRRLGEAQQAHQARVKEALRTLGEQFLAEISDIAAASTKTGQRGPVGRTPKPVSITADRGAAAEAKARRDRIRTYARAQGIDINPFGSIRADIVQAYDQWVAAGSPPLDTPAPARRLRAVAADEAKPSGPARAKVGRPRRSAGVSDGGSQHKAHAE